MKIRKYIVTMLVSAFCLLFPADIFGAGFNNETLKYVVTYKWGLIHKDAGDAVMTLHRNGDRYDVKLTASSRPWADRIYRVRDTLTTTMRVSDLKPLQYVKRMHERNRHDVDIIRFTHNGNNTKGQVSRQRTKNGAPVVKETTLTATGPVYDFLSMFFYLRKLDYSKLDKNRVYTATVFSGDKKETVKIKSLGIEKIKMRDKTERSAYHIKFNFTRDGGKKSSDDIDTWISTDGSHVPLYLVGQLPVGEVRVYLESGS